MLPLEVAIVTAASPVVISSAALLEAISVNAISVPSDIKACPLLPGPITEGSPFESPTITLPRAKPAILASVTALSCISAVSIVSLGSTGT